MFAQSVALSARCIKCKARRELPAADRSRWPAIDSRGGVTLDADSKCQCGASRVRVTVKISDGKLRAANRRPGSPDPVRRSRR